MTCQLTRVPEFLSEYQRNRRSVFQASEETRRTPPRCRRVFAWSATAEERAGVEYRYRILGGESRGRLELRARSTCRCSGSPPPQPEGARSPTGFPAARKCLAACSLSGSPNAPAAPPWRTAPVVAMTMVLPPSMEIGLDWIGSARVFEFFTEREREIVMSLSVSKL
ncbi:hypothetical protein ACB098_07G073200 [Castanea mollissima]